VDDTLKTVIRDTSLPVVKPENVTGWKSGDFPISGTVTNAGLSNVSRVEYRVLDNTKTKEIISWADANGTLKWSLSIPTDTISETLAGKPHVIEVRAYNDAGNMGDTVEINLNVDQINSCCNNKCKWYC
jgi:hypothetical protein